jgi:hypothetical protein
MPPGKPKKKKDRSATYSAPPPRGPLFGGGHAGVTSSVMRKRLDKCQEGIAEDQRHESDRVRSLQIGQDDRWKAIQFYTQQVSGDSSTNAHFNKLVRKSMVHPGDLKGEAELSPAVGGSAAVESFSDIAPGGGGAGKHSAVTRQQQKAVASVEERIEWQEKFDRSVRRLLVDFQLTDAPTCRLNHLDRMHAWFVDHGQKQARKVQKGPSYLMADRTDHMPAGSTRNLPAAAADHPLADVFSVGAGVSTATPRAKTPRSAMYNFPPPPSSGAAWR